MGVILILVLAWFAVLAMFVGLRLHATKRAPRPAASVPTIRPPASAAVNRTVRAAQATTSASASASASGLAAAAAPRR